MQLYIILISIQIFISSCSRVEISLESENDREKWPYNLKQEFSHRTLSPININSDEVQSVKFDNFLSHYDPVHETAIVKNSGVCVEVQSAQDVSSAYATGGIYSEKKFRFEKLKLYWTKKLNERSASAIDGKGSPFEVVLFYYNEDYHNFNASKAHRDGMAIVSIRVNVIPKAQPNPKFNDFSKIVEEICSPESKREIPFSKVFSWFTPSPATQNYFAYPGSYIEDDGTEFDCAVVLVIPLDRTVYVSADQFQVFHKLKNSNGGELTNKLPLSKRGIRPVIKSSGILGKLVY